MAYNLFWGDSGVYIKYSEQVEFQDLIDVQGKLIGNIRYDSIFYEIADLREVQPPFINSQEVDLLSRLDKAASIYHRKKQHILVSDKKEFLPLIEIYFKTFKDTNWETHLFTNLNEAYRHLKRMGIEVDH